jgi:hypothetical protein
MRDTATIISSQRYREEAIVDAKIAASDYVCTVSPIIEIDGESYRVMIDGHHSHSAAVRAGVDPVYVEADEQTSDVVSLLASGDVDGALDAWWIDDDWYDINTGETIWA